MLKNSLVTLSLCKSFIEFINEAFLYTFSVSSVLLHPQENRDQVVSRKEKLSKLSSIEPRHSPVADTTRSGVWK